MSNVEEFPIGARKLTEFDALVAAAPTALDAIPGAVYLCDQDGWLIRYNSEAVALWGRTPNLDGERSAFAGRIACFCPMERRCGTRTARWPMRSGPAPPREMPK